MNELEWREVPGGEYEIGLREDEARDLAKLTAARAVEQAMADPDPLHSERESRQLAEMWGNADYLYGQLAHSMPAHCSTLPSFAISQTPVSVADYARFMHATGASAPTTNARVQPAPEQPVTGISWAEAQAFASWAGAELPSEAMWEAALRPSSRSPFGAIGHDLYEWCADAFAPYPGADMVAFGRIAPPPRGWSGTRTRRGGAIVGFPVTVVCRRGADPTLRLRDTTFRLVRRRTV